MRLLENQPDVCVSITELTALKVARSTFNSGMHYRSVVIFGKATLIADDKKDEALNALSNAMIPGRVAEVRASTKKELAATIIVSLPLDECSVKISVNKGTWAGIVPFITTIGEPIPADEEAAGLEVPASVRNLTKHS